MKYEPLESFLKASGDDLKALSFGEIEQILGSHLPASARQHPAWWSNSPAGHVNAQAWLRAGYRTEQVDLAGEAVVFRRMIARPRRPGSLLERLAALGPVRVADGVDLTAPTGEVWDAETQ